MNKRVFQWRAHGVVLACSLRRVLRELSVFGGIVVLLVPSARGHDEWLGWWPLWLALMPASAWWAASGMPLPVLSQALPEKSSSTRHPKTRRPIEVRRRRRLGMTVGRGRSIDACASVRDQ